MKRRILAIILVLMCLMTAAASATSESSDNRLETETMTYTYETREIWCQRDDNRIFGIAYVPDAGAEKLPLVIFSHELGNSHTSGIPYAERLAAAGYAVYTFDFCGGTVGSGNRSDGTNLDMTVLTEVADLEAVLASAKTWDFVDPERIALLGGSQGGLVSALTGCRNQNEIAGLILMYPALCVPGDVRAEFPSVDDIPDTYGMFGGWIHVSKQYALDAWDIDPYAEMADYAGHVLLMHGDRDYTVDISYSERAAEVLPDCEYVVIPGGGHEFYGQPFEEAVNHILDYLTNI